MMLSGRVSYAYISPCTEQKRRECMPRVKQQSSPSQICSYSMCSSYRTSASFPCMQPCCGFQPDCSEDSGQGIYFAYTWSSCLVFNHLALRLVKGWPLLFHLFLSSVSSFSNDISTHVVNRWCVMYFRFIHKMYYNIIKNCPIRALCIRTCTLKMALHLASY